MSPVLKEFSIVASHSCPAIPPRYQQLLAPVSRPTTEPELEEFVISHESFPEFGPNSPTRPPTAMFPVTVPLNVDVVMLGKPLEHAVF